VLNQQIMSILHSLKLFGMAKGLKERSANTQHSELSHAEFVRLLVQDEKTYRDNLRYKRLLVKLNCARKGQ
jgi:IstB-like ATP binding protein